MRCKISRMSRRHVYSDMRNRGKRTQIDNMLDVLRTIVSRIIQKKIFQTMVTYYKEMTSIIKQPPRSFLLKQELLI